MGEAEEDRSFDQDSKRCKEDRFAHQDQRHRNIHRIPDYAIQAVDDKFFRRIDGDKSSVSFGKELPDAPKQAKGTGRDQKHTREVNWTKLKVPRLAYQDKIRNQDSDRTREQKCEENASN